MMVILVGRPLLLQLQGVRYFSDDFHAPSSISYDGTHSKYLGKAFLILNILGNVREIHVLERLQAP